MLGMLLRYNTRHRLYFPKGTYLSLPQLNPISWSSHVQDKDGKWTNKHTKSIDEPRWLYRWRTRVFMRTGETMMCKRRGESVHSEMFPGPDHWELGPDGMRTCSYCGSIHYIDLMKIVHKVPIDKRYRVEPSDKRYKVYVKQPGVRNASEGAIKFYMHHLPETVPDEDELDYKKAVRMSNMYFEEDMVKYRAQWKADAEARKAVKS
jgi:hypothetical protein